MSERMEYQVALLKDGRFTNYETPSLFVDTDDEAIEKAKDWAHAFESAQEDAWLQVTMGGRGICSLRPLFGCTAVSRSP
jgi:hypothetical protein